MHAGNEDIQLFRQEESAPAYHAGPSQLIEVFKSLSSFAKVASLISPPYEDLF